MNPFNPAIGVPLAVALRIAINAITLLATRRIVVALAVVSAFRRTRRSVFR